MQLRYTCGTSLSHLCYTKLLWHHNLLWKGNFLTVLSYSLMEYSTAIICKIHNYLENRNINYITFQFLSLHSLHSLTISIKPEVDQRIKLSSHQPSEQQTIYFIQQFKLYYIDHKYLIHHLNVLDFQKERVAYRRSSNICIQWT